MSENREDDVTADGARPDGVHHEGVPTPETGIEHGNAHGADATTASPHPSIEWPDPAEYSGATANAGPEDESGANSRNGSEHEAQGYSAQQYPNQPHPEQQRSSSDTGDWDAAATARMHSPWEANQSDTADTSAFAPVNPWAQADRVPAPTEPLESSTAHVESDLEAAAATFATEPAHSGMYAEAASHLPEAPTEALQTHELSMLAQHEQGSVPGQYQAPSGHFGEAPTVAMGMPVPPPSDGAHPGAVPPYPNASGPYSNAAPPYPVAGGGPGGEPPVGPPPGTPPQEPKRSKKPFIIGGAAILAVIAIALAIIIPVSIHNGHVQRGDELAAAFNEEVTQYDQVWSSKSIEEVKQTLKGITFDTKPEGPIYTQTSAQHPELANTCKNVAALDSQLERLRNAKLPALTADKDAEASEAYRAAQAKAKQYDGKREAFSAFSSKENGVVANVAVLKQFCENYPKYLAHNDKTEKIFKENVLPTRTLKKGSTMRIGDYVFTCTDDLNCVEWTSKPAREKYAQAISNAEQTQYDGLKNLFTKNCLLSGLTEVCKAGATDSVKIVNSAKQWVSIYADSVPEVKNSMLYLPKATEHDQHMDRLFTDMSTNIAVAWQKSDPAATKDILAKKKNWQALSIGRYIDRQTADITSLLDALA